MKYLHPATIIGLIISLFFVVSTGVGLFGFNELNHRREVVVDLYQLRNDILGANLALRNAGVATTQHHAETELNKMLVTRSSANEIYDKLAAYKLTHLQRIIVNEMKSERPEYREAQLKVVDLIRTGKRNEAWVQMMYYQTLMDRYVGRVDKLVKLVTKETDLAYIKVQATLLAVFSMSIFTLGWALWRVFR